LGNDRPSLGARLGVGLSKPWGVWEGGFDERPGEPPADYLNLVSAGTDVYLQRPFLETNAWVQFVSNGTDLNKSMAALSPANPHIFVC